MNNKRMQFCQTNLSMLEISLERIFIEVHIENIMPLTLKMLCHKVPNLFNSFIFIQVLPWD
jgi:hypothetical protein